MEQNTIKKEQVLAAYIASQGYGSVIHYQTIESLTDERRGTSRYYNIISKAKKILEKQGHTIQSIGSGDYQVLYPGDYSGAYARQVKLARNRIRHGGRILKGAPVNDMTAEERTEYNAVSDFHYRMEARITGGVVEVKRLTGRPHPLSQVNTD